MRQVLLRKLMLGAGTLTRALFVSVGDERPTIGNRVFIHPNQNLLTVVDVSSLREASNQFKHVNLPVNLLVRVILSNHHCCVQFMCFTFARYLLESRKEMRSRMETRRSYPRNSYRCSPERQIQTISLPKSPCNSARKIIQASNRTYSQYNRHEKGA